MKKLYFSVLFSIISLIGFAQGISCINALPICTGNIYNFPAAVNNGVAEAGPNYGCLLTQPNPVWYYFLVDQSGPINFHISTIPANDVDFVCWGPFTSSSGPCTSGLTASCTTCPNNTDQPSFYPSGSLTDCSFSTSWEEDCHINGAITGEYYIIMITNYSNTNCNIILQQTNTSSAHGTMNSSIVSSNFLDANDNKVNVFPNPLKDVSSITFPNPENLKCTVSIFDITGKLVIEYKNITTNSAEIIRNNLAPGLYSVEIKGNKVHRCKLIVE